MAGSKEMKDKETDNVPEFVPSHSRYACCAQGCNYICPEEANLRHHLIALHDGESSFTCVHCKADLTPTDADNLLKHFKLHGLQLHKCCYCNFVHNLKNKVEKHVNDRHLDLPPKVITVRNGTVNTQNYCYWATENPNWTMEACTKYSQNCVGWE